MNMEIFKIRHLGKLSPELARKLLGYYAKRLIGRKVSAEQWGLKHYFYTLVESGGTFEGFHDQCYYSKVYAEPGREVHICSRIGPSSDVSVVNQIFSKRDYSEVIRMMRTKFGGQDPIRILDAGANVGYATLYFKTLFPRARVICIEPEGSNMTQLSRNLALNGFNPDITILLGGLWSRKAFLRVDRDAFRDQAEWSFHVVETPEPEGSLPGYSVQDILSRMEWDRIDLFKMDIEGAESEVFRDPAAAAWFLARTCILAIEIHDEFQIREKICRILAENQFDFFESHDLTIAINRNWDKGSDPQ